MSKSKKKPLKFTVKIERSKELEEKLISLGYSFKKIPGTSEIGFSFFKLLEILDDLQSKKLCDYCDYLNGFRETY